MRITRLMTAACILILTGVLGTCGVKLFLGWPGRLEILRPMAAAAVVLFLLQRFEKQRPQIALAFFSSLAGLYIVELTLVAKRTLQDGRKPPDYDTRRTYDILADLRNSGTNAYLAWFRTPPTTNDKNRSNLIPLSGVSQTVTVLPNESGRHPIYLSDELGFNNPAGWSKLPPAKAIALVGDSFVHGYSVEPHETIAARLNDRLANPTNRVVSLGMAGTGPLATLGTIVEYLRPLKPKKVIWCYYEGNDLRELRLEAQTGLARYLHDADFSQNLWNRQSEVDQHVSQRIDQQIAKKLKAGRRNQSMNWRWLVLGELRSRISYYAHTPRFPVGKSWLPVFSQVLERAKEEVESWGGELIFVYLPQFDRYHAPRTRDYAAMRIEVMACARELQLPVIDLHQEMFLTADDPLKYFPFQQNGHYNAAGYDKVAELIWKHLQQDPAISPSKRPSEE